MRSIMTRLFISMALVVATIMPALAVAESVLTQEMLAREAFAAGTIVSLDANPSLVVRANRDNQNSLYGVVTSASRAPISISEESLTPDKVAVASQGVVEAFVSDYGGEIKIGDRITASVIEGVGVKATESGVVVGVAQATFNAKTTGSRVTEVTDKDGKKRNVTIGIIPILIAVGQYQAPEKEKSDKDGSSPVPTVIQQAAELVAGRQVPTSALVLGVAVLLITLVASAFIVVSSSYAAVISVGRNPLARGQLFRSVGISVLMAILVTGVGAGIAYLIIRFL